MGTVLGRYAECVMNRFNIHFFSEGFKRRNFKFLPDLTQPLMPSTPAPQSVTSRYTAKLLRDGKNNEFGIAFVSRESSTIEGHHVGFFYRVRIVDIAGALTETGVGATPFQALEHALTKAGVTFR